MYENASKIFEDSCNFTDAIRSCSSVDSQQLANVILKELDSLKSDLKQEIRDMGIKLAHSMGVQLKETDSWFSSADLAHNDNIYSKSSTSEKFPDTGTQKSFNCCDILENPASSLTISNVTSRNSDAVDGLCNKENHQQTIMNELSNTNGVSSQNSKTSSKSVIAKKSTRISLNISDNRINRTSSPYVLSTCNAESIPNKTFSRQPSKQRHNSCVAVVKCEDVDELPFGTDPFSDKDAFNSSDSSYSSPSTSKVHRIEENSSKKSLGTLRSNKYFSSTVLKNCSVVLPKPSHVSNKTQEMVKNKKSKSFKNKQCITSKLFTCDICGKTFSKPRALKQHQYWHLRKCCICKKTFRSSHALNTHMKIHDADRESDDSSEIECTICNIVMFSKRLFDLHMKNHYQQKTFYCKYCSKMFFSLEKLRLHMNQHEKSIFSDEKSDKSITDEKYYEILSEQNNKKKPLPAENV